MVIYIVVGRRSIDGPCLVRENYKVWCDYIRIKSVVGNKAYSRYWGYDKFSEEWMWLYSDKN